MEGVAVAPPPSDSCVPCLSLGVKDIRNIATNGIPLMAAGST